MLQNTRPMIGTYFQRCLLTRRAFFAYAITASEIVCKCNRNTDCVLQTPRTKQESRLNENHCKLDPVPNIRCIAKHLPCLTGTQRDISRVWAQKRLHKKYVARSLLSCCSISLQMFLPCCLTSVWFFKSAWFCVLFVLSPLSSSCSSYHVRCCSWKTSTTSLQLYFWICRVPPHV